VLIGFSRMYLGVHWLTDVLAGWLLAGTWLAIVITTVNMLSARRSGPNRAPTDPRDRLDQLGKALAGTGVWTV
jgi:undecaprenyl-diphosphatase